MTNAEIIAKIRAEIERQHTLSNEKRGLARRTKDYYNEVAYGAEIDVCNRLLFFLSDLEKSEKPSEGLEDVDFDREITHIWGKCAAEPNDQIACLHIESFIEIARHFYELGCRRTAEKYDEIEYNRQRAEEESVPKDLEEASEEYRKEVCEHPMYYAYTKQCFIAGAKWDREQMMKEAVEGEYDKYPAAIYLSVPIPRMNNGDKIHIIVCKNVEE